MLLADSGKAPERRRVLGGLTRLIGLQRAGSYVYVLMEHRLGDDVPAVVGAASDPRRPWAAHLNGLALGLPAYERWRRRLLREGHRTARHGLSLYVVGAAGAGDAGDAEALRAELTRLAQGAYPLPLLDEPGAEV